MKQISILVFLCWVGMWGMAPVLAAASMRNPCVMAQISTERIDLDSVGEDSFMVKDHHGAAGFYKSKPKITNNGIQIEVMEIPTSGDGVGQILCKFKTEEAISQQMPWVQFSGTRKSCSYANMEILLHVQEKWPFLVDDFFPTGEMRISHSKDQIFYRGDRWKKSDPQIEIIGNEIRIRASSLRTSSWIPYLGGMRYCKLISPGELIKQLKKKSSE